MNTPEKCHNCEHLYVNAMCEDDPTYTAECQLGYRLACCGIAPKLLKALEDQVKYLKYIGEDPSELAVEAITEARNPVTRLRYVKGSGSSAEMHSIDRCSKETE